MKHQRQSLSVSMGDQLTFIYRSSYICISYYICIDSLTRETLSPESIMTIATIKGMSLDSTFSELFVVLHDL